MADSERNVKTEVLVYSDEHRADQMTRLAKRSVGKRLRYADLIGPEEARQPRMI